MKTKEDIIKNTCVYLFNSNKINDIINSPIHNIHIDKTFKKTKLFSYNQVFENINRGKRFIEKDRIKGDIPYVSAKDSNHGIWGYINNPICMFQNSIAYTTFGDAFYVDGSFTASDEVTVFSSDNLTIFSAMYIITEMYKNKYKYDFKNKAFANKWKEDFIRLPIDNKEFIDWKFMEDCIKSLPYSINLQMEDKQL